MPSRSFSARNSSWSRIEPAAADDPNSERPNRAPSSSAQETRRTVDRRLPSVGDPPQHLDPGEHVQTAVEPAAVRNRVECPPIIKRPIGGAAQREPLVARLVDLLLGAGRLHALAQEAPRLLPRVRPGDALRAVFVARELPQLARRSSTVRRGLERHGRDSTTASGV